MPPPRLLPGPPPMAVDVGGCGWMWWACVGCPIAPYRMPSERIGGHWVVGVQPAAPSANPWPPGSPPGRRSSQKLGMEFFFFFCEAPRPNRIRSADNFRVFFCQGCQGCPIGMKKAKTLQNRCCFFSRTKFFGKNAVITAIKHGFFPNSWAERLAWLGKS